MAKDFEVKRRFIELRAQGWSFDRCAEALGISRRTLISWARTMEDEIAALEAFNLESLFEEHFVQKAGRIRILGEQLSAVRAELAKRDLSDVATSVLLTSFLRLLDSLKSEAVALEFLPEEETESEKLRRELGLIKLAP